MLVFIHFIRENWFDQRFLIDLTLFTFYCWSIFISNKNFSAVSIVDKIFDKYLARMLDVFFSSRDSPYKKIWKALARTPHFLTSTHWLTGSTLHKVFVFEFPSHTNFQPKIQFHQYFGTSRRAKTVINKSTVFATSRPSILHNDKP